MRRFALLLALVAACSSDSTSTPAPAAQVCTPGQQVECPCPGGEQGAQACQDDGAGYDACDCPTGGTGGTSGASGSAGTAGTGGTAGSGGSAGVGGTAGTGGAVGICTSSCVASAEGYAACGARTDSCGVAEDCGGCEATADASVCVELDATSPTSCVPRCGVAGAEYSTCFDNPNLFVYACPSADLAAFWAAKWGAECLPSTECTIGGVTAEIVGCFVEQTPLRRQRLVERPAKRDDQCRRR